MEHQVATVVQSAVQSYWRWWRSDDFQHMHGPEYQVGFISGPSGAASKPCLMGGWGMRFTMNQQQVS